MTANAVVPTIAIRPDYSIPRIIIGAWQLSEGHSQQAIDRENLFSLFDQLVDLGFNTFDCADIYTGVEELLGAFLRRRRARYGETGIENIRIHTKFVPKLNALAGLSQRDVERTIDRSRTRLGVDRLDLVQFAWWDYNIPRYIDAALWLTKLRDLGRIHVIGATNFDHVRLEQLLDAGVPIALHQVQYSVIDSRPSRAMTTLASSRGVWFACYGTLAGGFLTNRYLAQPEPVEPFENRSLRKYKLIIDEFGGWNSFQTCLTALDAVARKHHTTIASVAIRVILEKTRVAACILGVRSDEHVDAIRDLFAFDLDAGDRDRIHNLAAKALGPRGNVFELERDRGGPHGRIMKYNLD